jgi:hypothetical protein
MARKRRLKQLEKKVSGLAKSVSRLERQSRRPPLAKRTTGRHATTTRKSTGKRAPTARKSTGTRAKLSGEGVLRGLPS